VDYTRKKEFWREIREEMYYFIGWDITENTNKQITLFFASLLTAVIYHPSCA